MGWDRSHPIGNPDLVVYYIAIFEIFCYEAGFLFNRWLETFGGIYVKILLN